MKKIFISVGEVSGDNYGAELIKRLPNYKWVGITGEKMEKYPIKSIQNIKNIAVVGLTEVIPKYKEIKKTFKRAVEELDKGVDLLIVIDFPGFNLKLLKEAKKRNIKTIYFIAPQVWAWGKGRIPKIAENTDLLISIFPFEKQIFKEYISDKFKVEYVGHPLLDIVKTIETEESFKEKLKIDKNKKIFGLLAGSREGEIKRNLPIMLKTAKLLLKKYPDLFFVIPVPMSQKNLVNSLIEGSNLPLRVVDEKVFKYPSYEVMDKSIFSIITSGTATLEATIIGNPFCIVYKTSLLTYIIGRLLVSIDFIGLPNIIANREIIKEFIQHDFQEEKLFKHITSILDNKNRYEEIKNNLKQTREKLGKKGALDRTAKLIEEFVNK